MTNKDEIRKLLEAVKKSRIRLEAEIEDIEKNGSGGDYDFATSDDDWGLHDTLCSDLQRLVNHEHNLTAQLKEA